MRELKDIPKGLYCYDVNGYCPHYRGDPRFKSNLYGFGYVDSVWCDYLKLNSAQLDFEGTYEENGSKCFEAHLLHDMCKICGINE